jgi:proteasome lid subunit RPN8/RPN11
MREVWLPHGVDMKGFAHSHPDSFERLSAGDMRYIARLLERNPDMDQFFAPIVLPGRFLVRPFLVRRSNPRAAVEAVLDLFDTQ